MLSKNNKILIGCLALLLVMSVGYALFSDTITINGTATAKGEFSIDYTCSLDKENSNGTGTCSISDKTITTTSILNAPGEGVFYTITLTNNGSIPAVLKTVDSSNNNSGDYTTSGDVLYFDNLTLLGAYYGFITDSDEYIGDSATEAAALTIQPGESLTMKIVHAWSESKNIGFASQPELPEDGASVTYTVTLGFEQITTE